MTRSFFLPSQIIVFSFSLCLTFWFLCFLPIPNQYNNKPMMMILIIRYFVVYIYIVVHSEIWLLCFACFDVFDLISLLSLADDSFTLVVYLYYTLSFYLLSDFLIDFSVSSWSAGESGFLFLWILEISTQLLTSLEWSKEEESKKSEL